MQNFIRSKSGISNGIFGAAVAALIVISAVGFGLYGTAISATHTTTLTATSVVTEVMTTGVSMSTEVMNHTTTMMGNSSANNAFMFSAKSGAMISSAWLLAVPISMQEYAVSIHAQGLEPNGTYIVEGSEMSGSMQAVPISTQSMTMNTTSGSEFQADRNGAGNYFIVLSNNPMSVFENIQLLFLPGMEMQNATLVATANFSSMSTTTETMMSGST